jgi:hypothetical protein
MAEEQRLAANVAQRKQKRKRIGNFLDYLWCSAMLTTTLDVVMHHGTPWVPAGLMLARLLAAAVLCLRG